MKGRKPQPAAIKIAKGNPGHRPIPEAAEEPASESRVLAAGFPFQVKASAKKVAALVGPQLRALNMLRPTDEVAFLRYCDTMASYWEVTQRLNRKRGLTYRCRMTNGGFMERIRPEFMAQERLARRLDTLEERFGLTPMSRQQYLLALMRNATPVQHTLNLGDRDEAGRAPSANLPKVENRLPPPLVGNPHGLH